MEHEEAVLLGSVTQAIKDLTKAVDKLESSIEHLDAKIEGKMLETDRRLGAAENKLSKQRGFFIAFSMVFPLVTGVILYYVT